MNINCIICSDLFVQQAEIYVTPCGHIFHFTCLIQWIERSKTCPQCRNRTTENTIRRVYFNVTNTDNIEDAVTLQHKLDNFKYQMTLKEKDVNIYKEKYKKVKNQSLQLRQEVASLENKLRSNESMQFALKDQISYYKSKAKESDKLTEELVKLRNDLKEVECVQTMINGSKEKVNEMIRNQLNKESLALMAVTLEKTLVDMRKKKENLEYKYMQAQNDASKYKREHSAVELMNRELRRELDFYKENWGLEKQRLKNKIEDLDKKVIELSNKSPAGDRSTKRIITESPIPLPSLTVDLDLIESPPVHKRVKQILDSDSPYLPVKSSSVSFHPLLNHKVSGNKTDRSLKFIMKSSDEAYNGLGGHSKEDIFPKPRTSPNTSRRKVTSAIPSSKFKKLNPKATTKKLKTSVNLTQTFCRD